MDGVVGGRDVKDGGRLHQVGGRAPVQETKR